MKKYDAVLFDLDGTLSQSHPGIFSCIRKSLEEMHWPMPSLDEMNCFIGPPLSYSYTKFCGMTMEQAEEAIERYRHHYRKGGIFECNIYEGVYPLLKKLKKAGVRMAIVTAKPGTMSVRIMEHFGFNEYIEFLSANTEDEKGTGKVQLIQAALDAMQVAPEKALMVGDTHFDCEGAKLAGVDFLGVLYGYETEEQLLKAGAEKLAKNPMDIEKWVLKD